MKEAAEGHLTTEALNWNQDNQKTISGMVYIFFCSHFNIALIERIS
jgi:gamma-aminobutyric acid type B receptor